MPSYARYVLKDSHPAVIAWAKSQPQTSKKKSSNNKSTNGAWEIDAYECKSPTDPNVNVKEVLFGLQMAMMSITDDRPDTLKNVGKANPWQIQSVKLIVGDTGENDNRCHLPLTQLLQEHFHLTLDGHIDHSGLTKAGHALDTQGFIAHNDETVVLAYRCTTSAADWLTNLTTTTSAFEPDEDHLQGHSGYFSCFDCCLFNTAKANLPFVHTGFYNNFLSSIVDIKKYLDPLVLDEKKDRTLFIAGHSLGAGIAAVAACYFLLNPLYAKVKIRVVTAGGPRAVTARMKNRIDKALTSHDAKFYRCVRDKDGVPNVPPSFLGFTHLGTTVFITKADPHANNRHHVLINPSLVVPKRAFQALAKEHADLKNMDDDDDDDDDNDDGAADHATTKAELAKLTEQAAAARSVAESNESYNKKIAMIPRSLRDHMPEFYLLPMYAAAESLSTMKIS